MTERASQGSSLSLGFLALLPLLCAYELAHAADAGLGRNTSELVLFRATRPLPLGERELRIASLSIGALAALVLCFRRRVALLPGLLRILLEGILCAVLLGPLLALAMRWLPEGVGRLDAQARPPDLPPSEAEAGAVMGGAAYEELLFRVGLYSLAFLLALRVLLFFGTEERAARLVARGFGISLSSIAFAGFHLAAWTGWLGQGGEAFSAPVFAWRACAGLLLCTIFLARGPGVAAWAHGLFNFALLVGAGPEVLL